MASWFPSSANQENHASGVPSWLLPRRTLTGEHRDGSLSILHQCIAKLRSSPPSVFHSSNSRSVSLSLLSHFCMYIPFISSEIGPSAKFIIGGCAPGVIMSFNNRQLLRACFCAAHVRFRRRLIALIKVCSTASYLNPAQAHHNRLVCLIFTLEQAVQISQVLI